MIERDHNNLKKECLSVLDYYLKKTQAIMNLYQDTEESQYFLFALNGTKSFLIEEKKDDLNYLKKCINSLISGQKGRNGNDHLTNLRHELEEELKLIKLRYDLN